MTFKDLFKKYILKHPFWIIISLAFGIWGGVFNGISTALVVPIALQVIEPNYIQEGKLPGILEKFLAIFNVFDGDLRLIVMIVSVIILLALKNLMQYFQALITSHFARIVILDLRIAALKILADVDIDFFNRNKGSLLIDTVNQQINRTAAAVKLPMNMLVNCINIAIFGAILISISWQLTLATFVFSTFIMVVNQVFVTNSKKFGRILTQKSRLYSSRLLDMVTGIRLVKTTAQEQMELDKLKGLVKDYQKSQFQLQVISAAIGPMNEMSSILVLYSILLMGKFLFFEQLQSISAILLTYLVVLVRMLPLLSTINKIRTKFAGDLAAVEISSELLTRGNKPFMNQGFADYQVLQEGIHFQNLSFHYPNTKKQVLKNIELFIPKGKTVALVGESGSGKSTIADLLTRFYDPTQGKITLDNQDLKNIDLIQFRRALGVVGQDTFLFNNTVRYNLVYGLSEVSQEDVITAAKQANAYEFICRLPQGFETQIGDRGVLLSGGQRQRLAIARALLRNPDILILDEATSSLDTASERLVQQAIEELCHDRTTLVIAHRLSTIQSAYKIAVLDQGKIVEMGNHQELLAQKGYYANLHALQFSGLPDSSNQPQTLPADNRRSQQVSSVHTEYWQPKLSHETRTRLNAMLGLLRLVADDLFDDPQEKIELVEECYDSAMELLNTVERFETKTA